MPDNLTFSSHLEFSIPANDKKHFRKAAAQQTYRRIYREAGQAWDAHHPNTRAIVNTDPQRRSDKSYCGLFVRVF